MWLRQPSFRVLAAGQETGLERLILSWAAPWTLEEVSNRGRPGKLSAVLDRPLPRKQLLQPDCCTLPSTTLQSMCLTPWTHSPPNHFRSAQLLLTLLYTWSVGLCVSVCGCIYTFLLYCVHFFFFFFCTDRFPQTYTTNIFLFNLLCFACQWWCFSYLYAAVDRTFLYCEIVKNIFNLF